MGKIEVLLHHALLRKPEHHPDPELNTSRTRPGKLILGHTVGVKGTHKSMSFRPKIVLGLDKIGDQECPGIDKSRDQVENLGFRCSLQAAADTNTRTLQET